MAEDLATIGRYFWLHEALVASGLLEGAGANAIQAGAPPFSHGCS
jgi:hypothetical protein